MSELVRNIERITIACAIALGGTACSGSQENNEAPTPRPIYTGRQIQSVCHTKDSSKWKPIPSNFNIEHLASRLPGVPINDIAQGGRFGSAKCEQGFTTIDIDDGNAVVSVVEVGSPCLIIGTHDKPESGKTYTDILAVCATPVDNVRHSSI